MNAVVTYIFGTNMEILREPLVVEPGVEYICVTDNSKLKSKFWKIIYDNIPQAACARDKMVYVKYNPFKYTKARYICVIDGSIEISSMLSPFFAKLGKVDMLVKHHPQRDNLEDELHIWNTRRNLPDMCIYKFMAMSDVDGISLTNKFLIESCVLGYNTNLKSRFLCTLMLQYMAWLGNNGRLCITNQCALSYLLQKYPISIDYINQDTFFNRYLHNSWTRNLL